jgi:hypothetical protein
MSTSTTVSTAADATKTVAGEASQQTRAVAGEAKAQAQQLLTNTKTEIQQQADERGKQAAERLRSMSGSLGALLEGRPEEAQQIMGYLEQARTKLDGVAERIETAGPQGLVDDLSSFARRRPGTFLLAAGAAGFAIGRLARAGSGAVQQNGQNGQNGQLADQWSNGGMNTGQLGTPGMAGQGSFGDPFSSTPLGGGQQGAGQQSPTWQTQGVQ